MTAPLESATVPVRVPEVDWENAELARSNKQHIATETEINHLVEICIEHPFAPTVPVVGDPIMIQVWHVGQKANGVNTAANSREINHVNVRWSQTLQRSVDS